MLSNVIDKKYANSPDYNGIFTLNQQVNFKEGIEYIYSGWIISDGSINLKILPKNDLIKKVEYKSIESEPEHISTIIKKATFEDYYIIIYEHIQV